MRFFFWAGKALTLLEYFIDSMFIFGEVQTPMVLFIAISICLVQAQYLVGQATKAAERRLHDTLLW